MVEESKKLGNLSQLDTEAGELPAANLLSDIRIKGWINFDGTAVTNPATMTGVRDSYNVSSVLDNGVGDYTIAWDTDFADTNYCWLAFAGYDDNNTVRTPTPYITAVGSVRMVCINNTGGVGDALRVCVIAIGAQ